MTQSESKRGEHSIVRSRESRAAHRRLIRPSLGAAIICSMMIGSAFALGVTAGVVTRAMQSNSSNDPSRLDQYGGPQPSDLAGQTRGLVQGMLGAPPSSTNGTSNLDEPSPASSSLHWWFTNTVLDNGYYQTASAVFYNFTTPEDFPGGDTIFVGASAWDTYYSYPTVGDYDQEGFVGGSWSVTQTSSPCSSNPDWCAYFSLCEGSANNGYCDGSSSVGFTTWEYEIQPSTAYEDEMTVTTTSASGGWLTQYSGFVFYIGANNAHQLIDSWSWTMGTSITDTQMLVEYEVCFSGTCPLAFTDYEEIYSLNSVEAWPMFNIHTSIGLIAATTKEINWGGYEWIAASGSTYPTNAPGTFVESYSSGQNYVNIDNQRFGVWVVSEIGNGWEVISVTSSEGSHFSVPVNVLSYADPTTGILVYYYADYCSLPCGDYAFSPEESVVDSGPGGLNAPNSIMWINGTVPSAGTYLMSVYAYDPSPASYSVSEWQLEFTN